MKRIFLAVLVMAALSALTGCGASNHDAADTNGNGVLPPVQQQESGSDAAQQSALEDTAQVEPASGTGIVLTIGDQTFSATLLDNETVRQLMAQFPLTLDMSELNGNEKFFYLDSELPTDAYQPGQIKAGDLMLYGNNCLVLFYESFSSGYSYTRLGSIDDPAGLAEALGTGSVAITFSSEG